MTVDRRRDVIRTVGILVPVLAWGGLTLGRGLSPADDPTSRAEPKARPEAKARKLSHEETLRWITEHRAWRPARKTKPIWARPVRPDEVGKEFQTADHVKQVAREDAWLCVGVAGEPWFQARKDIERKYDLRDEEKKRFDFDLAPQTYHLFRPKGTARNWVARVHGADIEGFFIRPSYDPKRPLYSPAGGYVVMDAIPDPYASKLDHVWLVQEPLFESTYEIVEESGSVKGEDKEKETSPRNRTPNRR